MQTDDRTTLTFLVTMRSQQDADVYIPLLNEDTVKALKQRLTPPSPNMPPPPQPPLPGTPVVNDIVFESSDTGDCAYSCVDFMKLWLLSL